mmetsp:Transcript_6919/g.12234  ORF Transcript_6919/g.12234 Transcript_6919/m.12234 type:complete len:107 (+) Transcript_6919:685-1005(+)
MAIASHRRLLRSSVDDVPRHRKQLQLQQSQNLQLERRVTQAALLAQTLVKMKGSLSQQEQLMAGKSSTKLLIVPSSNKKFSGRPIDGLNRVELAEALLRRNPKLSD